MASGHQFGLILALFLLALFAPCVVGQQQLDPCADAVKIGNEKRSVLYTLGSEDMPLCDIALRADVWYTFEERTGNQIPELATIHIGACGTSLPIFIQRRNGSTYHEEAKNLRRNTTAVAVTAIGTTVGPITIRYCPSHTTADGHDVFVYRLAVPAECDLSYCAGDQPACLPGQFWNGLKLQCVDGLPEMTADPLLRGPELTARIGAATGTDRLPVMVRQFAFYCDVGYQNQTVDNGARFRITLSFDNVLNEEIVVDDANATHPSSEIPETLLRKQMGKTLRCHVQSFWVGNIKPLLSDGRGSSGYWIGIKSTVNPVVIVDGPTTKRRGSITYVSTVPITCWHCTSKPDIHFCPSPCFFNFTVGGLKNGVNIKSCQLQMMETEHVGVQPSFVLDVEVTQTYPTSVAFYNVYFEKFVKTNGFGDSALWKDYNIRNVTVEFRQSSNQLSCQSLTDPHIYTLQGGYIDNYLEGVFNLLSSKPEATNMNLQIQVRQQPCGLATCNCAVIIREWNNAHMFDWCQYYTSSGQVSNAKVITLLQPSDTTVADVWRDATGTTIVARFPSGLEVTVIMNYYFNIEVKLPGFYSGSVDGLCTETVYHSGRFRLTNGDQRNMFTHEPNCSYVSMNDFQCDCLTNTSDGLADFRCTGNPIGKPFRVSPRTTGNICGPSSRRRRRAASSPMTSDDYVDPSEIYRDISYDPNPRTYANPDWPTPSGITQTAAESYCQTTMRSSPAYANCAGKFDESGYLRGCTADVQLLDQLSGAEAYRTAMESSCLTKVYEENNVTSAEDAERIPAVVAVTQNICPNGCSGHGTCSNAACTCTTGFVGPDCSIDANSPPVIISLYQNGMCRTNERACAHTNVAVSNVYDAPNLTCRYKRFHLTNSSLQMTAVDTKGSLNTAGEIRCPSPDDVSPEDGRRLSIGYKLSVSNDGILFSNERTLIVSDPACLTCPDNTSSCQQVNNTCFIDSLCHVKGERKNASANCLTCEPQSSGSSWTDTVTWSAYSACSRTCDSGVMNRRRVCAAEPSPALGNETDFCQKVKCPGKIDERTQGIIMTTSTADLKVILAAEQTFFVEISKAVNVYCGSHAVQCCAALRLSASGLTGATMNVTTRQQCYYAASYPDRWSVPARNKVIVKAFTNVVPSQCSGKSSLASEIYFDKSIILQAVTQAKTAIGNAVGITIVDVMLA